MSPIIKIALRQLKNNKKRNFIMMAAVGVSMALVTFFVFFKRQIELYPSPHEGVLFDNYLDKLSFCINATVIFLISASFISINTFCKLKTEEIKMEFALLSALGATNYQKNAIILSQLIFLYPIPIALGTLIGVLPGIAAGRLFLSVDVFTFEIKELAINLTILLWLIVLGIAVTLLSYAATGIKFQKESVIEKVNSQNIAASQTRHGYRNSKTFRSQPFVKKLGKKSAEYYDKTYNAISRTFALALCYPAIAFLVLFFTGFIQTPWDTTVEKTIISIMLTLILCMLILASLGFFMVILLSKYQIEIKKQTIKTYLAVGMTPDEIKSMIIYELKSVILRSVIHVIFAISAMFIIFDGYCKVFNLF